jgi:hypothetical protein
VQTRNRLSLAYLTVNGTPPVEHLEAAAAGGFEAAGLRIVAPSHLTVDYGIVGDRERIREINRAKERTGVGVLDIEICTLDTNTDIERFLPALETAAQLGASFVQSAMRGQDRRRSRSSHMSRAIIACCPARAICGSIGFSMRCRTTFRSAWRCRGAWTATVRHGNVPSRRAKQHAAISCDTARAGREDPAGYLAVSPWRGVALLARIISDSRHTAAAYSELLL